MYTFKPQDKHNSKRFLTKTCKIDIVEVDQYLAESEGRWGVYLDETGAPVRHQLVYAAQRAAVGAPPAGMPREHAEIIQQCMAAAGVQVHSIDDIIAGSERMIREVVDLTQDDLEDEQAAGADKTIAPQVFGAFAFAQLTATRQPDEAEPARPLVPVVVEKNRPQANGIKRPSTGTQCAKVWDLADAMLATLGRVPPLNAVAQSAMQLGVNQFTARTQYACWRKFNGFTGRLPHVDPN